MEIRINSHEEFDTLLNALSTEIVDAEIYYQLYKNLMEAIPDYEKAYNQSNTFWSLTTKSLVRATLSCLCRVYDQNSKSLNLVNLLDTIKANMEIFDTENFKQRLRNSPFVESLSKTALKPDIETLNSDIESVQPTNPLVKKLIIWRNNIIAHTTARNILNERDIVKAYPITQAEISELLTRSTGILNKYSGLFRASVYSTQVVGEDDYLYVLKAVQEKVRRHEEEIAAEINRHQ